MKTIYLVRHAKSSWEDANQPDIERTLNKRGLRDAPIMGELLRKKKVKPQLWISSPAVRAHSTAILFAKEMDKKAIEIKIDDVLYSFKEERIIKMIEGLDDGVDSVILFFHNPSVSIIATYLTDDDYEFPTCAVLGLELNADSWKEITKGCGTEILYENPKK